MPSATMVLAMQDTIFLSSMMKNCNGVCHENLTVNSMFSCTCSGQWDLLVRLGLTCNHLRGSSEIWCNPIEASGCIPSVNIWPRSPSFTKWVIMFRALVSGDACVWSQNFLQPHVSYENGNWIFTLYTYGYMGYLLLVSFIRAVGLRQAQLGVSKQCVFSHVLL